MRTKEKQIPSRQSLPARKSSGKSASASETLLKIAKDFESLPPDVFENITRDYAQNMDYYFYGYTSERRIVKTLTHGQHFAQAGFRASLRS